MVVVVRRVKRQCVGECAWCCRGWGLAAWCCGRRWRRPEVSGSPLLVSPPLVWSVAPHREVVVQVFVFGESKV